MASRGVNKVILVGHLGQDRYTTGVVVNVGGTMQMLGGRSTAAAG